ncbi:MAG: hypothetical protein GEU80_04330 [Dehalococcoidia bacterium]|nr:hypothetical protein [Dehalococcoidia bacterium]
MATEGATTTSAYLAIPRELIAADTVTGVHLYLLVGDRHVLYRSGRQPVGAESLEKLRRRNVAVLYVDARQGDLLRSYMTRHLDVLLREAATPQQQSTVLREATRAVLQATLHRLDEAEAFEQVRLLSDVATRRIAADVALVPGVVRFAGDDGRLFTHATNVSAYAVALASRTDQFALEEVVSIGLGALVHDAGLAGVAPALLWRPEGTLTDMERDYLARHPKRGLATLQRAGVADPIVLDIVHNHHQDEGPAQALSPHASIVRLADTFDTLTSLGADDRQGPFAALYQMRHRMEGFPPGLIRDFVLMLGTLTGVDVSSPIAPLSRRPLLEGVAQPAA